MITSIIFSKDRPLQLDLCLNSIKKNFKDSSQNIVIYNNSEQFDKAHKTLQEEHQDVEFWQQSDSLFKDIFHAVAGAKNDFICFFTDDDIFFTPFACRSYDFLNDTGLSCLSLRMGLNIEERSHDGNIVQDLCKKAWQTDNGMIAWPKTIHGYGSYWSYDLSVDGHIYRKSSMLEIMDELCFIQPRYNWGNTPNVLESTMQRFWANGPNFILSPRTSVVVNSPNNRVQQTHKNKSGEVHDYSSEFLLDKYESGSRIDLDMLDFSDIKCPHTEIDILKGLK
mgnify:CR=1 FL=1